MKNKIKGTISVKKTQSAVLEYNEPLLLKALVKVQSESDDFKPEAIDNGRIGLKANIPHGPLSIAHRGIVVIDCGFSLELTSGYKAIVAPMPDLARRGCMFLNPYIYEGKVTATLINLGREILTLEHKQMFGCLQVEQIYYPEITL